MFRLDPFRPHVTMQPDPDSIKIPGSATPQFQLTRTYDRQNRASRRGARERRRPAPGWSSPSWPGCGGATCTWPGTRVADPNPATMVGSRFLIFFIFPFF